MANGKQWLPGLSRRDYGDGVDGARERRNPTWEKETNAMKFKTKLLQGETKNVVGIVIPAEGVERLGAGKRPPVKVTINGYTYRTTVAVMAGNYMVGVAAEHRAKANVKGGDAVEVELELDTAPREIVVPADLSAALTKAKALKSFDLLAPSHRKEHVRAIEEAKSPETRARRIEKVVQKILETK
jgi:bifunctional DNA-binding transcriptional regulator/antitoxin component of YhaV-PrlF toxin-antitoxin module